MDFILRCNSLKCRTQLIDRAVVTTCSHIFCINCSDTLGLAAANSQGRHCPACKTQLANPDDVVATSLNPTEDYKTSVLSGLSPSIIMEIVSRAMAFWTYQTTQEVIYQEYLAKTLTDKHTTLNVQMDKLINDANAEIDGVNQRFQQMQLDQQKLKQDNQTLVSALREKNKKHAQTRDLYERLKRREMTAATQNAAYDSVDEALQAVTNNTSAPLRNMHGNNTNAILHNTFSHNDVSNHRSNPPPIHIRGDSSEMQMPPPPIPPTSNFLPDRLSNNILGTTPSSIHRTRLGATNNGNYQFGIGHDQRPAIPTFSRSSNLHHNSIPPSSSQQRQTPRVRRPLGEISGNARTSPQHPLANGNGYHRVNGSNDHNHGNGNGNGSGNGNSGYGLTAGMRSGSLRGGNSGGGGGGGGQGGAAGILGDNRGLGSWMN